MILKAEITIDIDDHRKVWLELTAKPDKDDDIAETISALAEAAAKEGLNIVENREARDPDSAAARQARELETFGDEDD